MKRDKIISAIINKQIIPFFQIIKCNKTGELKYECLARLKVGNDILSPISFLNIAREEGLSWSITEQMFQKTFHYFSEIDASFSLNINFSDVSNGKTKRFICDSISNFHSPKNVTLEILEDESIDLKDADAKVFIDFVTNVKAKGCKIAIDDFGSGYSNFMNLVKIDVDILKIDGSLIKQIKQKNVRLIVEAIVSMAEKLNIKTVAEFVENEEIDKIVCEIGVDFVQGYFHGKPREYLIKKAG